MEAPATSEGEMQEEQRLARLYNKLDEIRSNRRAQEGRALMIRFLGAHELSPRTFVLSPKSVKGGARPVTADVLIPQRPPPRNKKRPAAVSALIDRVGGGQSLADSVTCRSMLQIKKETCKGRRVKTWRGRKRKQKAMRSSTNHAPMAVVPDPSNAAPVAIRAVLHGSAATTAVKARAPELQAAPTSKVAHQRVPSRRQGALHGCSRTVARRRVPQAMNLLKLVRGLHGKKRQFRQGGSTMEMQGIAMIRAAEPPAPPAPPAPRRGRREQMHHHRPTTARRVSQREDSGHRERLATYILEAKRRRPRRVQTAAVFSPQENGGAMLASQSARSGSHRPTSKRGFRSNKFVGHQEPRMAAAAAFEFTSWDEPPETLDGMEVPMAPRRPAHPSDDSAVSMYRDYVRAMVEDHESTNDLIITDPN